MNKDKDRDRREEGEESAERAISLAEEPVALARLDARKNGKRLAEAKNKPLRPLLVAIAAAVALTGLMLLIFYVMRPQEKETANSDGSDREEYLSSFVSKEAAQRCIALGVSLRLGAADLLGGESVGGVIVSEDGWILSGAPIFKGERGRIYARLCDGEDRAVEQVLYDGEGCLTLYKISAEGLSAAVCREEPVGIGEELMLIFSCGAPDYACALASAVSAHTDRSVMLEIGGRERRLDGILQADAFLGEYGGGAAAFDGRGRLVGISVCGGAELFVGKEKILNFIEKIS